MTKSILLSALARQIGGQVVGHADPEISSALPIQDALEGSITLADSEKQLPKLLSCKAVAVLTRNEISSCDLPCIIVDDLHSAFQQCIRIFRTPREATLAGIHPSAVIDESAHIGAGTNIGPGVSIGEDCSVGANCTIHAGVQVMAGTSIGDDCVLFPNVVMYPESKIGDRCMIHANATLGAYGFGYRQQEGKHIRTAQLGWVEVENDVEIGAGTTIDRGTYGATKIGEGTKIDNQVQIGHNCHIGPHNLVCAQVGIAGSSTTGKHVVLAGQAGLADHIHLNDGATIGAQAGVMQDVDPGQVMLGSPAGPRKQKMTEFASMMRLPEMRKELRSLKRQFDELRIASESTDDASQNKAA